MAAARTPPNVRALRKVLEGAKAQHLCDRDLLERYLTQRDESAFVALVRRHGPRVLAGCRQVLAHDADVEDAFQATFLALARAVGTLGSRQAVAGWLHRVAMNSALNMKAQRRSIGLTDDVSAPPAPDGELAAWEVEWEERLFAWACEQVRRDVSDLTWEAFWRTAARGQPGKQVAADLGLSVTAVYSARSRVLARLKELIQSVQEP